jgi:hypothetical protein
MYWEQTYLYCLMDGLITLAMLAMFAINTSSILEGSELYQRRHDTQYCDSQHEWFI